MKEEYIKIKDARIKYIIASYKTSKHIKMFFKDGVMKITKPYRVSKYEALRAVLTNEDLLYKAYFESLDNLKNKKEKWNEGKNILYHGENYKIVRELNDKKKVGVLIDKCNKVFKINVPNIIEEKKIDVLIKKKFKEEANIIIGERLNHWSKLMKIEYSSFRISDTVSKFGSCIPISRKLQFSDRLVMFDMEKIDAIIVHELSHIKYGNHGEMFYNLVEKYIPNYNKIIKDLKNDAKDMIM